MNICIHLLAVITLTLLCIATPNCAAQDSFSGPVLRAFNVTFLRNGQPVIAVSTWFAYQSLDVALSTPFGSDFTIAVQDPCSVNLHPCSENGRCIDVNADEGLLQCKCNQGFNQTASTRVFDSSSDSNIVPEGTFCPDINECAENDLICGPNTESCVNIPGSYTCNCKEGFFLTEDKICDNIDECADDSLNNCNVNSTCTNTVGSFTCTCKPGLTGDGVDCEDINECADDPCVTFAVCTNLPGSYVCSCPTTGFTGDGDSCEDINECADDPWPCHTSATCSNQPGSYVCSCNIGFTGDGNFCEDINECEASLSCHKEAVCTNTEGAFSCECRAGFIGNGFDCRSAGSKLSYCYRMAVSVDNFITDSTVDKSDPKISDSLPVGISNLFQELQKDAFDFVYESVEINVEDILDTDTSTRLYIAVACFNNTEKSASELTSILESIIPISTFEGFPISVSEFDECAYKYRTCANPLFVCANTDGGYKCMDVLNEKEKNIAKTIMLSFYSPLIGPLPLIEVLMKRKHIFQMDPAEMQDALH